MTFTVPVLSHRDRVLCSLCGRNNSAHLVFCEECGNRLAPKVAPPTPLVEPPAASPAQAASLADARPEVVCSMCGTKNPLGERFCMACGQTLPGGAPPAPRPAPVAASQQVLTAPIPVVAQGAPPAPVLVAQAPALAAPHAHAPHVVHPAVEPSPAPAPAAVPVFAQPVIDVGTPPQEPQGQRVCGRCRGANLPTSLFCRYCGNSLAQAQSVPSPVAAPLPEPVIQVVPAAAPVAPAVIAATPQPAPVAPVAARVAPAPTAVDPVPSYALTPSAGSVQPIAQPSENGFDLPKGSAELAMPEAGPAGASGPQASARAPDPSTERDASVRKGTWLNTKTKAPRGHLVVITKEGTPGPSYPIYDQVDIGRSEGDVVLAEDRYLSPRHARLVFREDRFFLRDLDSVNGLFLRVSALRGRKVSEIERAALPAGAPASQVANVDTNIAMELQDQDLILIGQQVLRFEALRDAEAGLGPASEHGTLLFGTPTSPRYARLSQRTVEGVTRDVYYIRKVETVLGRESGDVVFTDDPFLSRRHAAFLVLPSSHGPASPSQKGSREAQPKKRSAIHLVDLGSSNGTFLGLRGETEVRSGDLVRMGQQLFRIDLGAPNA